MTSLRPAEVVIRNVRTLREAAGTTQAELAERLHALGWSSALQSSVANLERGRRSLSLDDVLLLAAALDVPPQALLVAPVPAEVSVGKQRLGAKEWHALMRVEREDISARYQQGGRPSRTARARQRTQRQIEKVVLAHREEALGSRSKFPGPTFVSDRALTVTVPIPNLGVNAAVRLRPGVPHVARDRLEADALSAEAARGAIRRIDRFEARRLRSKLGTAPDR